jgi:hypothetical protein
MHIIWDFHCSGIERKFFQFVQNINDGLVFKFNAQTNQKNSFAA